jgi:phage tail-like protein
MRLEVNASVTGFTLRLTIPPGLSTRAYRNPSERSADSPILEQYDDTYHVVWHVTEAVSAGARYDYEVVAEVEPTDENLAWESEASVVAAGARAAETIAIAVRAQADYLRYLPAFYSRDALINRWLMLFQSFWQPIEKQIDSLSDYFDARLTPAEFLPWLATWIDLTLDARWPEDKQRLLLRRAVALYRMRGTRRGLQEFLKLYTDVEPEIVEHRGVNFQLGPTAHLGAATALGTGNVAHTFSVRLRLPPSGASEGDGERLETERRRMIETIIQSEKPAHTAYELKLETHLAKTHRR